MSQPVIDYNLRTLYWNLKKRVKKEPKNKDLYLLLHELGFDDFKTFIKSVNIEVAKGVIENPFGIKLTENSGVISVRKKKDKVILMEPSFIAQKGMTNPVIKKINWNETKKTGILQLKHFPITENFNFKFDWNRKNTYHKYLKAYYIKFDRVWKRELVNKILAGKADYPVLNR